MSLANLQTALDNLEAAYATATASGNLAPSYSIDGQTVDYPTYLEKLLAKIERTRKLISGSTPFRIMKRGA